MKRLSKLKPLVPYGILFFFMWILFAFNSFNIDRPAYDFFYQEIKAGNTLSHTNQLEKLFSLLLEGFVALGIDFQLLLVLISFLGLAALFFVSRQFSRDHFWVMLLYAFFPYFLDIVQIRNFIALAIIFISTWFLFNDKKYGLLYYLVGNLLAFFFHRSAIFFLLIPIVYFLSLKMTAILSGIGLVLGVLGVKLLLPMFAAMETPFDRYDVYFTDSIRWEAQILFVGYLAFNIFIMYGIHYLIEHGDYNLSPRDLQVQRFTFKIAIALSMIYPLLILTVDFYRIYRNFFIFFYMVYCLLLFRIKPKTKKERYIKWVLVAAIVCFVLASTGAFLWFSNREGVIYPILQHNLLWSF